MDIPLPVDDENIISKINEDRLQKLMEMCKAEYPDVDDYFIWLYSVEHLLQEQGYEVDETDGSELYKRSQDWKYNI